MTREIVIASLFLLLAGAVCFYWILPAWRDYRQTQRDVLELRKQLARQQAEIRRLNREIAALKNDPYAVERVAREKFGWCRDGEKVYHFDKPAATSYGKTVGGASGPRAPAPAPAAP